jgi:hypothetical protein
MGQVQYSAARRLDRILDSQGDGTGTISQVIAATSISGATNATPIVITANSHGYSDGDFVHITGVVGNTAANDLHVIQSTTTNTFELTTPAGTNVAGNGSYDSAGAAHLCFVCKPAAGEQYCIHSMRGHGIDVVAFMTKYFNVNALAVGIEVQVRQDTTLLHTLTPTPIKTTPMWQLGGVKKIMGESGAYGAAHWAHSYESCTVNLDGDADEFYAVLHSTAIGGTFKAQEMSVIGEVL